MFCFIIAERTDLVEMARLLQLILGCAVNCEDKQGTTIITPMVFVNDLMRL